MNGARATWCWTDPPWNVAYGASDHPTWKSREILNDNLGDKFPAFCRAFKNAFGRTTSQVRGSRAREGVRPRVAA